MTAKCTFCGEAATLVPTEECRACRRCAERIAELASTGEPRGVWHTAKEADEEANAIAQRVAESVKSTDALHSLAVAFREMALYQDALRAAGKALALATTERRATAALRLIVMPPILREDGLQRLARQMKMN